MAIPSRNPELEAVLQSELGIPSLLAAVLVSRGMADPAVAYKYLYPSLDDLGSPDLLPDFKPACEAILGARERKEKIFVHGDYDVDGVSSAALFTRFLRRIGCDVHVHVPHRMIHGYGVHEQAIYDAKDAGAKLFLTCDCGISAHSQVAMAREAGLDVVITDHHTIGESLPEAHAVVNPHRVDSRYPFAELAGVGVVFRLCEGLTKELGYEVAHYRRAFLDLAVLGTIADVMPLDHENRIIASHGLRELTQTKKPGLKALFAESNVFKETNKVTSWAVGWVLGPRLNAAGRIDDAALSLKLLMSDDTVESGLLARQIEEINRNRKDQQDRLIAEAVERVVAEGLHLRSAIVVSGDDWHPGIIGLVAGRLVEKFRRPAFVLSVNKETGEARASARSIPNFNLAELLAAHTDLVAGGGHAMAAGFSTTSERVAEVALRFDAYAAERLSAKDFEVYLHVDVELRPEEITFDATKSLEMLEPTGAANTLPMFFIPGLEITQISPTKNPDHVRLGLKGGDRTFYGPAFNQAQAAEAVGVGGRIDVYGRPSINSFNGREKLEIQIKHFEPAGVEAMKL